MSPWRDVPNPKWVPSLYCALGGSGTTGKGTAAACSTAAAGIPSVATGAGEAGIVDVVSVWRLPTDGRGALTAFCDFVVLPERRTMEEGFSTGGGVAGDEA